MALAVGAGLATLPAVARAHGGEAGVQTSLWTEGPGVLALLATVAVPYAHGVRRLWSNAGHGRGIGVAEAASFAAGIGVLAIALLGPLAVPATDEFSGHMAQHLLLIVVAAPLLAFGQPARAYAWALRGSGAGASALRRGHQLADGPVASALTHPAMLLVITIGVTWTWHVPPLYDLAARREVVHGVEHVTMLGAAFAFWWRIRSLELGAPRRRVAAFFLLFAAMFPELVLGAFIAFAGEPLYESHRLATEARGGDPLADQQLGGLVMLMLGGVVYAGVALTGLLRVLSQPEARPERGWEA